MAPRSTPKRGKKQKSRKFTILGKKKLGSQSNERNSKKGNHKPTEQEWKEVLK